MKLNLIKNNRIFILTFASVLFLSLFIRLAFFNGIFGSDDGTYLYRSLDVANGEWTNSDYIGAMRYGYNIPSGLFIYLFGLNIFTANLWALFCSLIEISLVFIFAWKYIGHKAALFSALFLAFIPLHVAVSTRLHADPVVSMFITLSFVTFYKAEQESSRIFYFLTGLFLGCVFWTKEVVGLLSLIPFLFYPVFFKKIKYEWLYLVLGGIVMLLAHFALMQIITGNPLHILDVAAKATHNNISNNQYEDNPWYYFRYLFIEIKHTWLIPLFAPFIVFFLKKNTISDKNHTIIYSIYWLLSLLVVLSFLPVSINPLKFTMKQSNYMTLFLAPIAIISGYVISVMPRNVAYFLTVITLSGGLVLSALEQQDYRVFTANSRGLLPFIENHPNQDIYGSVNNQRIYFIDKLLDNKNDESGKVHNFSEIPTDISENDNTSVFIVIDRQTLGKGINDIKIEEIPHCWREIDTIIPANIGNSHFVLDFILTVTKFLPSNLTNKLQAMQNPKPAKIYTANISNFWCTK